MNDDTRFLNGLRFLLSCWVMLGHFYAYVGGLQVLRVPLAGMLLSPAIAVDGFMVLSGFLMAYHYIKREHVEPPAAPATAARFFARRLFRLYPVYVVAIVLAYALNDRTEAAHLAVLRALTGGTYDGFFVPFVPRAVGPVDLLAHLTFVHGLVPAYVSSLCGPAWSLSLEMQFYAAFPLLYLVLSRGGRAARTLPVFLAAVAAAHAMPRLLGLYTTPGAFAHFDQPAPLPYKLHLFVFGILVAQVRLRRAPGFLLAAATAVLVMSEARLTSYVLLATLGLFYQDELGAPLGAATGALRRALSGRLAEWGAEVSYSVYLLHATLAPNVMAAVVRACGPATPRGQAALAAIAAATLVCFAVAHVLFVVLERPCVAWGKRVVDGLAANVRAGGRQGSNAAATPPSR